MKKMKICKSLTIKFLALFMLMAFSGNIFAQRQPDRVRNVDRIKAQRIAFLTEKMSLTPEEAQKLWPVLIEFNDKRKQLLIEFRASWLSDTDVSKLTDKEAEKYAEAHVLHIEKSAKLARELHEELKKILPPKKIALLYEAEEEFNRKLMRDRIQRGRD
jgi:hypothetical protein